MTREDQEKIIQKADEIICKGHTMITAVYFDRKEAGDPAGGDAFTQAVVLISDAIMLLRDSSESSAQLSIWDRKQEQFRSAERFSLWLF